ncbi:zinc finger A20 and AN1 domain-containing stress-associated protein 6 [Quercus suber]|uniref:Zinc finger a20 and an1 domain-containing stress-associated protein 4 n=1 Tax=Quercus suber TaxID=58331 RepID=A0AAW0M723_QUESU
MAEEHRCEASEGHRLCVNNCGFFGSPATMNLCAKCYTDIHLQEQHHASSKSSIEIALSSSAASSSPSSSNSLTESLPPLPPPALTLPEVKLQLPPPASADVAAKSDVAAASKPNRCLVCRKRVGLTGFKCRCGTTFCGVHRYPEKHACTFDFKAVGREEIARANPIIKAEKLRKI